MRLIYISMIFALLGGCKSDSTVLLPNVSGRSGEVLVVMKKDLWTSMPGEALRDVLYLTYPALPQDEPHFSTLSVGVENFNHFFNNHRNIIYAKINTSVNEPKMFVKRNVWAKPQTVIIIEAPDIFEFKDFVYRRGKNILDIFSKAERERLITNYTNYQSNEVVSKLNIEHGINIKVPMGYNLDVSKSGFAWISQEKNDVQQGIFVYSYPFNNSKLNTNFLISKRDSILKINAPGALENSYITTEKEFYDAYMIEKTINDQTVFEVRGLWKLENGTMGGPFVSISIIDTLRNRIVTVDGYVYAPKLNKRNYIRQIEAILHTFSIADN